MYGALKFGSKKKEAITKKKRKLSGNSGPWVICLSPSSFIVRRVALGMNKQEP